MSRAGLVKNIVYPECGTWAVDTGSCKFLNLLPEPRMQKNDTASFKDRAWRAEWRSFLLWPAFCYIEYTFPPFAEAGFFGVVPKKPAFFVP